MLMESRSLDKQTDFLDNGSINIIEDVNGRMP